MTCRFEGEEWRERLVMAMCEQEIVKHDRAIAEKLAMVLDICPLEPGQEFISQGALTHDMYFLLAGSCTVLVNGRVITRRERTQQVGEMSLIDPMAERAATVVAHEATIVGKITQKDFTAIAETHPVLWRRLARELAARLRQRNIRERLRNDRPRVFIGSSSESRRTMDVLLGKLEDERIELVPWTRKDFFKPSSHAIEDLEVQARTLDFAVLVFGPDDRLFSRWRWSRAPRDNVIFELGLFMGSLGRRRTFIVEPKSRKLKIPSDLVGINTLGFGGEDGLDEIGRLLRDTVLKVGPI